MELHLFDKYQLATTTKLEQQRINPCYEIANLFVKELNKTAGKTYVTREGKKGKTKTYTEIMVLRDLKAINKDVHAMTAFLADCEKSSLGFRMYYNCKLK